MLFKRRFLKNILTSSCQFWALSIIAVVSLLLRPSLVLAADPMDGAKISEAVESAEIINFLDALDSKSSGVAENEQVENGHQFLSRQQEFLKNWFLSNSVIHFSLDKQVSEVKKHLIIIETKELVKLYQARNYAPFWIDDDYQQNKMIKIFEKYMNSDLLHHGLHSEDYITFELKSLLGVPTNSQNWMYIEIMMSEAFLRMGKDLAIGRINYSLLEKEFKLKQPQFRMFENLLSAMHARSEVEFAAAIDKIAPQSEIYKKLVAALANLRKIEKKPEWLKDIVLNEDLKLGRKSLSIIKIRQRLNDLGYEVELDSPIFDNNFLVAVKEFQLLNSLMNDGIISKKGNMIRILNKAIKDRIIQVELNIERIRFLPRNLETSYVIVNTAFADLKLIENGNTIMRFKTVVGKPTRRTPSKKDVIENVILNPTWTIPKSIVKKDKLDKIRDDISYLKNHNIKVLGNNNIEYNPVDFEWNDVVAENFPYQLVQQPGFDNSLGAVKFPLYRHADDIYLHDTNEKNLFGSEIYDRHKSSGCIRLEKPMEFAEYLLKSSVDGVLNLEALRALVPPIRKNEDLVTQQYKVNKALPVYIVYLTVDFGDKGQIRFAEDIYGQDRRFLRLLNFEVNRFDFTKIINISGNNISGNNNSDGNSNSNHDSNSNRDGVENNNIVGTKNVIKFDNLGEFVKPVLSPGKSGLLIVSGEPGPTQLFAFVKAIPCKEIKGKVQRASCQINKAIALSLNVESKLEFGTYILGYENSIYPGFVRISSTPQKIQLEKIKLEKNKNNLALSTATSASTFRIIRDFSEGLEISKNLFQTYFAQQPIFRLAQYDFGGLYLKGSLQRDVSSRLNYRVCDSNTYSKFSALSDEAQSLCENTKIINLTPNLELFSVNRINGRADGTFTEKWINDDIMDVVEIKHPYHLVAAPIKIGEFVSVFPGAYRIIDDEGKVVQKFANQLKDIPMEYKMLFIDFQNSLSQTN